MRDSYFFSTYRCSGATTNGHMYSALIDRSIGSSCRSTTSAYCRAGSYTNRYIYVSFFNIILNYFILF